jgi:hypothetical protein
VGDADSFRWAESDERLTAACFTAVVGVGADEVARRFGGDLPARRRETFADAFNEYPLTHSLVFDDVPGGVLVAENNGWEGARLEVATAVSRGGRLASAYWSVNADMTFVHAVDGVPLAVFDPLLIESPWWVGDRGSLPARIDDLPFGVEAPRAAAFALVERLTGVRIEASWLDVAHSVVDIVALPDEPVGDAPQ